MLSPANSSENFLSAPAAEIRARRQNPLQNQAAECAHQTPVVRKQRHQRRKNQLGGEHTHLRGIHPCAGNQLALFGQMACQRQLGGHIRIQICAVSHNQVCARHHGAEQEYRRREQTAQPLLPHRRFLCLSFGFRFDCFIISSSKKAVKPSLSPFTNAPSVVTLCRRNFYIFSV